MSEDSRHIIPKEANISVEGGGQIVLYQPNESISLEVKLDVDADTVWLSQQQIANLFGVQKAAISKHMKNIINSGELVRERVVSKMETTASDGKHYIVDYYNLDMILSVGYRVNSANATRFRMWANTVLKEYLLKGYALQPTLKQVEYHLSKQISIQGEKLQELQEKVHRWLIIDDLLYHCGHSLNATGRKLSAITLMGTSPEDILSQME